MKKFILIIAVLTLSLASVWGEYYYVIPGNTTSQGGKKTYDTETAIPFDLNNASEQTIEMIIPSNKISNQVGTVNDNPIMATDFEYIESIVFYASQAVNNYINNLTCTLSIKSLGTSKNQFSSTTELIPDDNMVTFSNCSIKVTSDTVVEFDFADADHLGSNGKQYFDYKKADGSLYIKITITLGTEHTLSGTWAANTSFTSTSRVGTTLLNKLPKTTLNGSRIVKAKILNGDYKNDEYTFHTGFNNFKARLERFISTHTDGSWFFTKIPVQNNSPSYTENPTTSASNFISYELKQIPENITIPFQIDGKNQQASVIALGDAALKVSMSTDRVIYIPASIEKIGDDNTESNECFYIDNIYNGIQHKIVLVFQCKNNNLPTLYGSNFTNFTKNTDVELYVNQNVNNNNVFNDWTTKIGQITAKFGTYGWISYPYRIKTNTMYKSTHEEVHDFYPTTATSPYKISSYPFANTQLVFELSDVKTGEHDGSWCHYYQINSVAPDNSEITATITPTDYKSFSSVLNRNKVTYDVTTDFNSNLIYGEGKPFFDYSADKHNFSGLHEEMGLGLFSGSKSINFKLDNTNPVENVPYWMYTNVGSTEHKMEEGPDYWSINCPITVEKKITSATYRYFSLPFDCHVKDITIVNLTNNEPIEWLTTPIEDISETETLSSNYFIIDKYAGQQSGSANEGTQRYEQVKPASGSDDAVLEANHGYAFAIVEKTVGVPIEAKIIFKSKSSGEKLYLNTYAGHTITLTHPETEKDNTDRNKGWQMIGNPFYHYLNPSSFYGEQEGGTTKPVKYITKINDDQTVDHRYVDESWKHSPVEPAETGQVSTFAIKPFEAFFIQVESSTTNINIYPADGGKPYGNLPAENPEIKEIISVKVADANGQSDKTGIIEDDTRDEHFRIGDDLAKIMNPGIQIYTWYDSVPCAFKELPLRADSTMAIPLGYIAEEDGNYTFSLDTAQTLFYGSAMLHDKQENRYHPLDENGVLIALTAGENNIRFEIVVVPSELPTDVDNIETSETLDAYVHDGHLVVENIEEGSNLSIYDISGKLVYSTTAAGDFNYNFTTRGVYMVVLRGKTTGTIKVVY